MQECRLQWRSLLMLSLLAVLAGCIEESAESDSSTTVVDNEPPPPAGDTPTGDTPNGDTPNAAPTISGNPPGTAVVGELYTFTPQASDPDGDELIFSIENQPGWADFDEANGTLAGVAPAGSEGNYANIRISVSDGSMTDSLASFSIDVAQLANGSATLSWIAPTQNDDGTPLTDLAGYNLYYGNTEGSYPHSVEIGNPGLTTYVVENLVPGDYFFAITAVNSLGIESDYSAPLPKTVN